MSQAEIGSPSTSASAARPRPASAADVSADSAREARRLAWLTAVALLSLLAGWLAERAGLPRPLWLGLYLLAYASGGYSGVVNGWRDLRQGVVGVDLLMLIAAAGAASIGHWVEGGVLLFLFSLSETLQTFALGRTRGAIEALMALRPDEARRIGEAGEEMVPVEALEVGDVLRVLPGERVPVDAVVQAGESELDESAITGESVPVARGPGDSVFGATHNGSGVLELRVARPASESTLARVIGLVEEAQASQAPTQRFIDRFGSTYFWVVVGASAAMVLIPVGLLGWSFDDAFYRAMTLLVVASPCALVISTPAAYLSGIAAAARQGVLFKGGAYLEAAATVEVVALDKTGTLTEGRPELTDLLSLDPEVDEAELLGLAAAIEGHSEHLIAQAVVQGAARRGLPPASGEVGRVRALHGLGVEGRIDGRRVIIGRARLFQEEEGGLDARAAEAVASLERAGRTAMLVAEEGRILGVLAVADRPRARTKDTLAALRAAGIRRLVMLTGDNEDAARKVAAEVGIAQEDVHAGLMPEDKVDLVRAMAEEGGLAFVGDGVNDAPALAAAQLGVAMGAGGSDVALETADVVLMADRIDRLALVFGLGRRARRIVIQNVAISLGVIALLVLTTVTVGLPLPIGVVGHEGSTVVVVLNGLRLLRVR